MASWRPTPQDPCGCPTCEGDPLPRFEPSSWPAWEPPPARTTSPRIVPHPAGGVTQEWVEDTAPAEAPPEPDTVPALLAPGHSMIPGPNGPVHIEHRGDYRSFLRRILNATRRTT